MSYGYAPTRHLAGRCCWEAVTTDFACATGSKVDTPAARGGVCSRRSVRNVSRPTRMSCVRPPASSMIILHMDAPVSTSRFFGSEVISRKKYGRLCSKYLTGRQSHIKSLPSVSEHPLPCVPWPMPTEPMPSLSSSLATASSEPTIHSPDMPVASPPKNFY